MSVISHFLRWKLRAAPAETQTTDAERKTLANHAHGKKSVVEIGVWHGDTTALLRSAMAEEGVLYAVDPFFPGRLGINFQQIIAHAEVGRISRGGVRWIRHCNSEAVQQAQEVGLRAVDFIFVDGDHSYEGLQRDWENWSPLIERNGFVALHDSRSTPERDLENAGSMRFTGEVVSRDARFAVVEMVDSLTVLQRR